MKVTDVRIKLVEATGFELLRAFCSITLDYSLVVKNLRILQTEERLVVAMPSGKIMKKCSKCNTNNHLLAKYCNECGNCFPPSSFVRRNPESNGKAYYDIVHPIDNRCRVRIESPILEAYNQELKLSREPGYKSRYYEEPS